MDDRLQKALSHANYKLGIVQQKENAKLRFSNNCLYAKNGGIFTVTPQLIAFVDLLVKRGDTGTIIIDNNGNPVMIENLEEVMDEMLAKYAEATNEFHHDYETIRKARTVKSLLGV
jgi:DUF917 family protein